MSIQDDRPNVEIKTVSTKDKWGAPLDNYLQRVADAVARGIYGDTLAVVELLKDRIARVGYWERAYIVAWQNSKEFGTHRVVINGDGESMLTAGYYFKNAKAAYVNLAQRSLSDES